MQTKSQHFIRSRARRRCGAEESGAFQICRLFSESSQINSHTQKRWCRCKILSATWIGICAHCLRILVARRCVFYFRSMCDCVAYICVHESVHWPRLASGESGRRHVGSAGACVYFVAERVVYKNACLCGQDSLCALNVLRNYKLSARNYRCEAESCAACICDIGDTPEGGRLNAEHNKLRFMRATESLDIQTGPQL